MLAGCRQSYVIKATQNGAISFELYLCWSLTLRQLCIIGFAILLSSVKPKTSAPFNDLWLAQSDQRFRCPHEATLHPYLYNMRPVKILIKLRWEHMSNAQPYRVSNPWSSDYHSDALIAELSGYRCDIAPCLTEIRPLQAGWEICFHILAYSHWLPNATGWEKCTAVTGLEPGTLGLPFRCSTDWAIRPPLSQTEKHSQTHASFAITKTRLYNFDPS